MNNNGSRRCDRKLLAGYLKSQLDEEDTLTFLMHLDACPGCWEEVYSATKATHPHFYKSGPRKSKGSDRDIEDFELPEAEDDDSQDVFEVA